MLSTVMDESDEKKIMHAKAAFVFWTTLILYLLTLCTVSYVGVYLTYIAIPIISLSGLIMKCSKPKPEYQEFMNSTKTVLKETGKASSNALEQLNVVLKAMNNSLDKFYTKVR